MEHGNYSELDNPVYRDEFSRSHEGKEIGKVQEEFLKGNWYVFGTWASNVMKGELSPSTGPVDAPHASFWNRFLEGTSAPERKEFLDLLLEAQLANSGIRYRAEFEPVRTMSPTCERWLNEYFSSFENVAHSKDPNALLGMRLVYYSHMPEERMVRLAGPCLGSKALPHLARFLGVQRRYYHLHTDYSTSPVEIDGLFLESLRTLIWMGRSDPRSVDGVTAVLDIERSRKDPEQVRVEHVYDRMGMGPPDRTVNLTTLSPDSLFEEDIPRDKATWAGLAVSALRGDATAWRAFQDPYVDFPGAAWVRPVDQGVARILGDRLFYQSHFLLDNHYHMPTLWSVDIPSGATHFKLNLGYRFTEKGLKCDVFGLDVEPGGDPILYTRLLFETGSEDTVAKVVTFDQLTGEVRRSNPMAKEPRRQAEVIVRTEDGHVLRRGNAVWKQGHDGEMLWERTVPNGALVRGAGERMAVMTDDVLEIVDLGSNGTVLERELATMAKDAGLRGSLMKDIVMHPGRLFLFGGHGSIIAFDPSGGFLWEHRTDGTWNSEGRPCLHGDRLAFWGFEKLTVLSIDGNVVHKVQTPERLMACLLQGDDVFLLTEESLLHQRTGSEEATVLDSHLITHMSKLIGSTKDHLLVLFYKDRYHLACIPEKVWKV